MTERSERIQDLTEEERAERLREAYRREPDAMRRWTDPLIPRESDEPDNSDEPQPR